MIEMEAFGKEKDAKSRGDKEYGREERVKDALEDELDTLTNKLIAAFDPKTDLSTLHWSSETPNDLGRYVWYTAYQWTAVCSTALLQSDRIQFALLQSDICRPMQQLQ